jgi:glutathione peroxidase-family protein
MRKELLEYQRDFYVNAKMKVKKVKQKPIYSEMKKMQQG